MEEDSGQGSEVLRLVPLAGTGQSVRSRVPWLGTTHSWWVTGYAGELVETRRWYAATVMYHSKEIINK